MSDNPFASPTVEEKARPAKGLRPWVVVKEILKYFGTYVCGILLCIVLTDAEVELAGKNLVLIYLILSIPGVALWIIAAVQALPSPPFEMWWFLTMILLPCLGEVVVRFPGRKRLRNWRPFWIGTPVGFVGTLGIYWAGSLSI